MSTVLLQPLTNAGISQDFTITKSMKLRAVRLGIIKHGTLDGDVTLELYDGATLLNSSTVAFADINDLATYANGMLAFELETFLGVTGGTKEYTLKAKYAGTESDSLYIGWKRAHENQIVLAYGSNQTSGVPISDTYSPFQIELFKWG